MTDVRIDEVHTTVEVSETAATALDIRQLHGLFKDWLRQHQEDEGDRADDAGLRDRAYRPDFGPGR